MLKVFVGRRPAEEAGGNFAQLNVFVYLEGGDQLEELRQRLETSDLLCLQFFNLLQPSGEL